MTMTALKPEITQDGGLFFRNPATGDGRQIADYRQMVAGDSDMEGAKAARLRFMEQHPEFIADPDDITREAVGAALDVLDRYYPEANVSGGALGDALAGVLHRKVRKAVAIHTEETRS